MKRDIRTFGDPVLREKSRPIAAPTPEIRALADDMIETMFAAEGCGLAAQQIGETRAICIVYVPEDLDKNEAGERLHPNFEGPRALLNPRIIEASKKSEGREEGCLSFPGIRGSIPRSLEIVLEYMDLDGKTHTVKLREFAARVVQHELDHLNGILFIDKMSPAKRFAIKRKLADLRTETQEKLGLA